MSENVTPYCSALLVCDHVHKDGRSGKHSVIGTFDRVFANSLPTEIIPMGVYTALAGGRGKCNVRIQLIHSSNYDEDVEPIFKIGLAFEFANPLLPVEMGLNLAVAFQHTGVHFLQLFANDELLLEKTITVIPITRSEP